MRSGEITGEMLSVLVVEDGEEYTRNFSRFGEGYRFVRAGNGHEALERLSQESFTLLFLDMRFDRVDPSVLLGDLSELTDRFGGDPDRARRFLEEHQGTYILSEIRAAGHTLPAVFSHDFDNEPKRWSNLKKSYNPVYYIPDNASAAQLLATFRQAITPSSSP